MTRCEYVEMNRDITHSELFSNSKMFAIFMELFLGRDCDTNSINVYWREVGRIFKIPEDVARKELFKLKKLGYVELYRSERKEKVIVAFRRNDDLYKIGEHELLLDDDLIIKNPTSKARHEKGYGKFRKDVLERDDYTCQICGTHKGLVVHHIKPYAEYPRLRTSVSNGITLCKRCHNNVHKRECDAYE